MATLTKHESAVGGVKEYFVVKLLPSFLGGRLAPQLWCNRIRGMRLIVSSLSYFHSSGPDFQGTA
jgi:hypothetical protein